jgi:pimeloyl-ACP methyl ester carboxylesterase
MTKITLWILLFCEVFVEWVYCTSFPSSKGLFNTTLYTSRLVDYSRLDPFASTPYPRELMISIFSPVSPALCNSTLSAYMPPTIAEFEDKRLLEYGLPFGVFESLSLQTCRRNPDNKPKLEFPVVIFSPAAGTTRLFYSAIAQRVSSFGYQVITIDHPYDADIVEFPDNTTILGLNFSDNQITLAVNTRAQDITFVLNQITKTKSLKGVVPAISCGHEVLKAGVFGHSLGGAAAAQAMLLDDRLVGGVNLDGSFFGDVVDIGLSKPFMMFAHAGKNISTDLTWGKIWPQLVGWKRELILADSAHYSFSDLPKIINLLGYTGRMPTEVQELLGSMDGDRGFEIVTSYIISFFDMTLKAKKGGLLNSPNSAFPEVVFG